MKLESSSWKNSALLYRYYFRDALHGLIAQLALRRKSTRIFLGSLLAAGYTAYIVYNFIEAGTLNSGLLQQSSIFMDETAHMLVASLVTMNFLYAVLVSIIVFLTFSLTPTSLYVSQTMAFTRGEVSTAQRFVKLTFASSIFLVLFVVEVSAISVVQTDLPTLLGMIILAYCVFIASYLLADLFLSVVSLPKGRLGTISSAVAIIILIVGTIYSIFSLRYRIDYWIGTRPISLDNLILLVIILSGIIIAIELFLARFPIFDLKPREYRPYFKIPLPSKLSSSVSTLFFVISAFLRSKFFLILATIDVLLSVILLLIYGYSASIEMLAFVTGTFSIAGIRYADTTRNIRPMLKTIRWNYIFEALGLALVYTVLLIPSVTFTILGNVGIDLILSYIGLFFSAVIIGFLFPKTAGNTNETASMIVLIAIFVFLALALEIHGLIIIVDFAFFLVMILFTKIETERFV